MSQAQDNSNDPLHAKKKAWSGRFSEPVDAFVLRYTCLLYTSDAADD